MSFINERGDDPLKTLGYFQISEVSGDLPSRRLTNGLKGEELALGEEIRQFATAHPDQLVYIVTETGTVIMNPGESIESVFDQLRFVGFNPSTVEIQSFPPEQNETTLRGCVFSKNDVRKSIERLFDENPVDSIATVERLDELVTMYCGSRIWFAYTAFLEEVERLPKNGIKEGILDKIVAPLLEAGDLGPTVYTKAEEVLRQSGYTNTQIEELYSESERMIRSEVGDSLAAAQDFFKATGKRFTEIETMEQLHEAVAGLPGATWGHYRAFIKSHHTLTPTELEPRIQTFILPLLEAGEIAFALDECKTLLKYAAGWTSDRIDSAYDSFETNRRAHGSRFREITGLSISEVQSIDQLIRLPEEYRCSAISAYLEALSKEVSPLTLETIIRPLIEYDRGRFRFYAQRVLDRHETEPSV